jgi:hypothetical protein
MSQSEIQGAVGDGFSPVSGRSVIGERNRRIPNCITPLAIQKIMVFRLRMKILTNHPHGFPAVRASLVAGTVKLKQDAENHTGNQNNRKNMIEWQTGRPAVFFEATDSPCHDEDENPYPIAEDADGLFIRHFLKRTHGCLTI